MRWDYFVILLRFKICDVIMQVALIIILYKNSQFHFVIPYKQIIKEG